MKFIDGDFFENISDFSFGDMYTKQIIPTKEILESVKEKSEGVPIFFIETHRLGDLLKAVSQVRFDVIIITHNSDLSIPGNFNNFPHNIKKIFSQNYMDDNPLIEPIPIGLERKLWFPERNKQGKIRDLNEKGDISKERLLYCNFDLKTNPKRQQWYDSLNEHETISMNNNESGGFDDYIKNISESKFIISPPGNGMDCHRNWEALYTGSIPVLEDNNFNREMFGDLPSVFIKDVNNIYNVLKENQDKKYDFSSPKLWGEYWEEKIKNIK